MTNWTPVQPLSDEPQNQAYWEPQQFKIGDRVRVRLSGECNVTGPVQHDDGSVSFGEMHDTRTDGCEGVVARCPVTKQQLCEHFPGHSIVVRQIRINTGRLRGGHYAACELEPLS